MIINTNVEALRASRNLQQSNELLGKSLARLSSGSKIVNPSDDAAGLAVSEKMDAQRVRVQAAYNNVQNAASYVQTADGFMKSMTKILTRMSELSTLAQDVTKNPGDIDLYNREFESLKDQLRSTIGGDEFGLASGQQPLGMFNGISLFGGSNTLNVTIGEGPGQSMEIAAINFRDGAMQSLLTTGAATFMSVGDSSAREKVIAAIEDISQERAKLGAWQSRLEVASENLTIQRENLQAAISRIRDVDVATETTEFAKHNILVQSGTAMLAQANELPQSVLRLIQ